MQWYFQVCRPNNLYICKYYTAEIFSVVSQQDVTKLLEGIGTSFSRKIFFPSDLLYKVCKILFFSPFMLPYVHIINIHFG